MTSYRRNSRAVRAGDTEMGGGAPISIQSMTTVDTKNLDGLRAQIQSLEESGCELVRVALYDRECARLVPSIKEFCRLPLIGDVHFDAEIAVIAAENGIDKIRINPGNIGSMPAVRRVVDAARSHGVPIRVGANGGSLPRDLSGRNGHSALAEAAMREVRFLEQMHFYDIVISVKSSSVPVGIEAARIVASETSYPLHLGVTEAGTREHALVKSAVGIGTLLMEGIGDTIRVSMSGDPVQEVHAARRILESCGLRRPMVDIISCPTCARCSLDVESAARAVEALAVNCTEPVTVAVMGCAVNGPGEARKADLGIAGAPNGVIFFESGKVTGSAVSVDEAMGQLAEALRKFENIGGSEQQ